jgi:hypothetical protein
MPTTESLLERARCSRNSLSEPQIRSRGNITDKWPRITGPFRLSTRMLDGRSSPPTSKADHYIHLL